MPNFPASRHPDAGHEPLHRADVRDEIRQSVQQRISIAEFNARVDDGSQRRFAQVGVGDSSRVEPRIHFPGGVSEGVVRHHVTEQG